MRTLRIRSLTVFDVKRLPRRALCDTGFWIRALGDRPDDARSADALEFFQEMTKHGREMLMATPTLAELIRGKPGFSVPSTPNVIVVGFDRLAAEVLGTRFNASIIKQQKLKTGYQKGYLQFDAMIVACAIRHKADCVVSFDNGVGDDIEDLGIPVHNIRDFRLPLLRDTGASSTSVSSASAFLFTSDGSHTLNLREGVGYLRVTNLERVTGAFKDIPLLLGSGSAPPAENDSDEPDDK
jgi:predicted nucleic acid-binding protein